MADLDTVELSDMLSHLAQRRSLEIEIKCKRHDLRIIVALEKALVCYEPFAAGSAFESGSLALSGLAVAPTQEINGVAESATLECENGLRQLEDVSSLSLFLCPKPQPQGANMLTVTDNLMPVHVVGASARPASVMLRQTIEACA